MFLFKSFSKKIRKNLSLLFSFCFLIRKVDLSLIHVSETQLIFVGIESNDTTRLLYPKANLVKEWI